MRGLSYTGSEGPGLMTDGGHDALATEQSDREVILVHLDQQSGEILSLQSYSSLIVQQIVSQV